MTAEKKYDDLPMMPGTMSGPSYLAFARNGPVILGIKPADVVRGENMGHPGTTWFGARVRSAPAGSTFDEGFTPGKQVDPEAAEAEESNVVQLGAKKAEKAEKEITLTSAWPKIEWELDKSTHARTTIGVLMRGSIGQSDQDAMTLVHDMKDGSLSEKMAQYLITLVEPNQLLISKDQIAGWLTARYFGPIAKKVEQALEIQKEVKTALGDSLGTFGMQAQLLKKAYQKAQEHDGEDADDNEAED